MKNCRRCGRTLPLDQFWKQDHAPDGKQYNCIDCCKDKQRVRRAREESVNDISGLLMNWRRA